MTTFGVLSPRASVVLRDAQGRTAVGRDVFLLHLVLHGDDISVFFKYANLAECELMVFRSLGLSTSAFIGMISGLVVLGVCACALFTFCRYRKQKKVDSLAYKPEKLDGLMLQENSD